MHTVQREWSCGAPGQPKRLALGTGMLAEGLALDCTGHWSASRRLALDCTGRWSASRRLALDCTGRWSGFEYKILVGTGRWGAAGRVALVSG